MSLKISTAGYIKNYSDKIKRLKELLNTSEAVVIGAGAGLSTSAGFTYSGERFRKYFSDFARKYGISDMYSGGFYPYKSPEEFWAYWSRYIFINRYIDERGVLSARQPRQSLPPRAVEQEQNQLSFAPKPVYSALYDMIKNQDYFVITTNVDHCFQKAGFDKTRLFYTQGDYGLFQCSEPCCQETFDNESAVRQMMERQRDMKIPTELLPKCPHCGKPMTMNLRSDDRFVEDEGWHVAAARYSDFIRKNVGRVLYLELGVGYNTPGIIKYPFWRMTAQNPRAAYACVNRGEATCPTEIEGQAICIDADIAKVVRDLK